jgi:hypothetical protein
LKFYFFFSVSSLLGLDAKNMLEALTTSGIMARGETIVRHNNQQEAVGVRDAMAKALYGRLFSWIVGRINYLLQPVSESSIDNELVALNCFSLRNTVCMCNMLCTVFVTASFKPVHL